MRKPSTLYADLLKNVQDAIRALEYGETSFQLGSTIYGTTDLPALYKKERLLRLDACIQAIEEGDQSSSFEGRSFNRANLADLYTERRTITEETARADRGGIRVRQGIPL